MDEDILSKDLRRLPLIGSTKVSSISIGAGSVIVRNNQVLLVKSKDGPLWKFPGGHLHDDESIGEGIKRETFEETGLLVELRGKPFCYQFDLTEKLRLMLMYYRGEIIGNDLPKAGSEVVEVKWFEIDNLPESCYGDVKPVMKYWENNPS